MSCLSNSVREGLEHCITSPVGTERNPLIVGDEIFLSRSMTGKRDSLGRTQYWTSCLRGRRYCNYFCLWMILSSKVVFVYFYSSWGKFHQKVDINISLTVLFNLVWNMWIGTVLFVLLGVGHISGSWHVVGLFEICDL